MPGFAAWTWKGNKWGKPGQLWATKGVHAMSRASPGRAYISLPLGRRRVIFAATSEAKTLLRMSEKLGKLSNGKHKSTLCTFPSHHHEKRTVSKLIVCLQGTFCEAHAPTHASLRMQSRRSEEPGSIGQRGGTTLLIFSRVNYPLFLKKSTKRPWSGNLKPSKSSLFLHGFSNLCPAWSSTAMSPRVIPASTISGSRRPKTWIRAKICQDQGSRLKHYGKQPL